ncbi:cellobiose phosphorylase [Polynucleobacter sp. SHI8]|uniref:ChbG/HpnK family deacetylase n=1 Tax=unclassified Polynucleobacter TaxID=2640945 RepID=UPI002491A193|nr:MULTISPECIES: ChbG/HpnK family deacetylase [unclassified Polynucleobacter]BDW12355.1 cellobiose phosphorylase [Polynucleobacter sp. SHI2]BDW14803.1 cellobiose phosphorylase [Polynucleobacter sp. SHI8]
MKISICADDIGQDPAITEGCLHLFELKRISQISVLSQSPYVAQDAPSIILARSQGLQVGLHFNLTLPFGNPPLNMPLNQLILMSQLRLLSAEKIQQSFDSQLKTFEDIFQFKPDFIDGHQHVHQFPQIREVLITQILQHYSDALPWIRSTLLPSHTTHLPQAFKCHLLNVLGGSTFYQLLKQNKLSCNNGFLGVYGFNAPDVSSYRTLMLHWLSFAQEDTLLMCHPANQMVSNDGIGKQRPIEFNYLKSKQFLDDLSLHQCRVF